MQYVNLGTCGLVVSRLSFGAMTFSSGNRDVPALYNVGSEIADRLVGQALDAGINFFDTADVYANGQSEEMLGRALAKRRKDVVICTKVGGRVGGGLYDAGLSRRHMMESIDLSLKRLGTDWIDLYLVHRDDPHVPMEEVVTTLDNIVRSGKVRYIGFSNWSAWRVAAAMDMMKTNNLTPFTHGQMYYSLLARDIESEFIPMLKQYGLGLTVWSPLAGGFLSGKYTREGIKEAASRLSDTDILPLNRDKAYAVIDAMTPIAKTHDVSLAQIGIAWLLAKSAVSSVLLGATKTHQLADTLAAANVELTAAELKTLDEASAIAKPYPAWFLDYFGDRVLEKALRSK